MKFNPLAFILNIALPLIIGSGAAFFTAHSVKTWYPTLAKPAFNPPDWIFMPVWTSLYILIGIAAYLVWQKRKTVVRWPRTIAIYFIQLIMNLMWSFIFFYARQIGLALIEIIMLLAVIAVNGKMFYDIDRRAGLLFVPYFIWVCFATVLTYSIFSLN